MKKITFILIAFMVTKINAQIQVKINDKLVTENQTISAGEIKKMELSIVKPVTLKSNSKGKARLYVELLGTDDKVVEGYTYEKEGYNDIDLLLKDTKATYIVYQEGGENKTFGFTLNAPPTLKAVLQQASTNPINKMIKVKVSLMFSDKTVDAFGVVHYGYRYDLLPVFQFNIKNENTDGSISLLEVGSTFSSSIAQQLIYKEQQKYKGYFYDEVNPLFTSKDVVKCFLQGNGHYLPIIFNTIDINKTQDEYINDMKSSFEEFLRAMSNQCNEKISKTLSPPKYTYWGSVISYSNRDEEMIIPALDGKNNKAFLTETIMKPTELGKLKGYKFNSMVLQAQCGLSFKDRSNWGYVNVYFLKHPKNEKKVLMVFSFEQGNKETIETAKATEDRIDLFLSSQKF